MSEFKVVGSNYPRHESVTKVTGRAIYTDDLRVPEMAYGRILRSPYPHARVLSIDTSQAKKVPGLLSILLPADVPKKTFNSAGSPPSPLLIRDERILTDHPLHVGDRVAAVAATSLEACEEALDGIRVDYEPLPAVFTIKEALSKGAPTLHPEISDNNIIKTIEVREGDVEKGIQGSDYTFEEEFYTPTVQQVPMEPCSCLCHFTPEGSLTVWGNSQTPFQERRILAELLEMPENRIRFIIPATGGGFGARQQLHNQHVAALLSRSANRPVKIINTREEEMVASAVRHESICRLRAGVTKEGTITAFHMSIHFNTGGYATHGPIVAAASSRKLQYRVANYLYEGHCVVTNGPVSGAMRGYGNPQITFAREVFFDKIAKTLKMDPVQFRLLNHVRVGDRFPASAINVQSCEIQACVDGAARIREELDRKEPPNDIASQGDIRESWGVAFATHTSGPSSKEGLSSTLISVNDDGTINLLVGSVDIGQGSETTLSQLAAEMLGIRVEEVSVTAADTLHTPYDTGTYASSLMYVGGNAVRNAALDLVKSVRNALGMKYGMDPEDILYQDTRFRVPLRGDIRVLGFKEAVCEINEGTKAHVLMGQGSFKAKESPPPFAVCMAKVAVDQRTKTVEVTHLIQAVDVGTAVNPDIVVGQVEGGISMGVGYALMEQVEIDGRAKKPSSSNLLHYRIPLAVDMPKVHVYIAKGYEPTGPFGAKSTGELVAIGIAPAIINAVSNATGEDIFSLPLLKRYTPKGRRAAQVDRISSEVGQSL